MFAGLKIMSTFATQMRNKLTQSKCPDGGIGRRVGLKHQWSDPCRFDPGSGYEEIDWLSDFYHLANFFISIAPLPLFWSRLDLPVILLNGSQHFDFLIILVENRVQMRRQ